MIGWSVMIRLSRRITGVIESARLSTVGAPAVVVIGGRPYFATDRWETVATQCVGREVTALVSGMFVDEIEMTTRKELNGMGWAARANAARQEKARLEAERDRTALMDHCECDGDPNDPDHFYETNAPKVPEPAVSSTSWKVGHMTVRVAKR